VASCSDDLCSGRLIMLTFQNVIYIVLSSVACMFEPILMLVLMLCLTLTQPLTVEHHQTTHCK